MSSHVYTFESMPPQLKYQQGYRRDVRKREFPVLKGMSLSHLHLEPQGAREPHWHPNAHELNFCLSGEAILILFGPDNHHQTFQLGEGEIAYVPMGTLHYIENIGTRSLEMLVAFNHEEPEDLNISSCMTWLDPVVLKKTFNVSLEMFKALPKTKEGVFISKVLTPYTHALKKENPYKFALKTKQPDLLSRGGSVRISNQYYLSPLKGLAVYFLILQPAGLREPHWHPNADELNYLMNGRVKITLISPMGITETFEMRPGDISFMPKGYFHYIENLSEEPIEMAVFFNDEFPKDIGLTGALGAYSHETLAALFNMPKEHFSSLPKFSHDLMIVGGA